MNLVTKYPARSGLAAMLIFILLSIFFAIEYAEKERSRDLISWQLRLSILADMRAASVEKWLDNRRSKLQELSNNNTLKLYLSQSAQLDKNDLNLRAQFSYVRNLLQSEAERFGFFSKKINSFNTEKKTKHLQGLAVLSNKGELIFSTRGFYKDLSRQKEKIMFVLKKGRGVFLDIFKTDAKHLLYGFVLPVFHIQKSNKKKPVGAIILLLNPAMNLFEKLKNNHLNTASDESLLIRKSAENIEYISPLKGDLSLLYKISLKNIGYSLNENVSLNKRLDYRGIKILSINRKINSVPWYLIQKIDAVEALQESNEHQQYLFTTFFLVSLILIIFFVAIWRHSTSVRLLKTTNELESRTALLNAVSDNISEHIFLLDKNKKFVFANSSMVKSLNIEAQDVCGKSMVNLLGPEITKRLLDEDFNNQENIEKIVSLSIADKEQFFHLSSAMLEQGEYKDTTLYVLHDITTIQLAQKKRDRLSQGIITTLVKAVDLHDPYCIEHSARTREVALAIAHEMSLEPARCKVLEMAALLANIGKLFVAKEILIKMDVLTKQEAEALRKNISYAVDILKDLEFEGPVIEVIEQKSESLDGSGYPNGLKSKDIMLEAKILAVSNAFVAMASSRAYRQGKSIKEATNILLEQAGRRYDRQVVAALFHIAENKSHWRKWQSVAE